MITSIIKKFTQVLNASALERRVCANKQNQKQNQYKQEALRLIKLILNNSVSNYVQSQLKKSNIKPILNKVTITELKQLNKTSTYLQIDLNLQIFKCFLTFQDFKKEKVCRNQFLKKIKTSINEIQNPKVVNSFMFAGKNRLTQIVFKMFDLLMIGYKCQIYQNIFKWTNDKITNGSIINKTQQTDKSDFWVYIKRLISFILKKCSTYSQLQNSQATQVETLIQKEKLEKYSTLLDHILRQIHFYYFKTELPLLQKCTEQNCLAYSIEHLLYNLTSFYGELNFINPEFRNTNVSVSFLSMPTKIIEKLANLPIKEQQETIKTQEVSDDDDELLILMEKNTRKTILLTEWMEILYNQIKHLNKFQMLHKPCSPKEFQAFGLISALSYCKSYDCKSSQFKVAQIQMLGQKRQQILPQICNQFKYLSIFKTSNSDKQIKLTDIDNIENLSEFFNSFFEFIMSLSKELGNRCSEIIGKIANPKYELLQLLASLVFKRAIHHTDVGKNLKETVSSCQQNPSSLNFQQSLEKSLLIIQFWCEIDKKQNFSCPSNLQNSPFPFISELFKIIKSKFELKRGEDRNKNHKGDTLEVLLKVCLQICNKNIKESRDLNAAFSNHFSLLVNVTYCYLKHLFKLLKKQILINQAPNHKFKSQCLLYNLTLNYLRIFNCVLSWPTLLKGSISNLKPQFQLIRNNSVQSNQSDSILRNIALIEEQNPGFEIGHPVFFNQLIQNNLQAIQDCLNLTQKIQANVFQIKTKIPIILVSIAVKAIVQQEAKLQNQKKKQVHKLNHLRKNSDFDLTGIYQPFNSFLQFAQKLSQLKLGTYFQKIIASFVQSLGNKKNQEAHDQNQQLKMHLQARKRIQFYLERVFITLLTVLRKSIAFRPLIEKIFWDNKKTIQDFIDSTLKRGQEKANFSHYNSTFENIKREKSLPSSFEEILAKWMIGNQSDFYQVKMMISSRLKDLITQQHCKKVQLQLQQIIQATKKALSFAQTINRHQNPPGNNLNSDIEQSLREKLKQMQDLHKKNSSPNSFYQAAKEAIAKETIAKETIVNRMEIQ